MDNKVKWIVIAGGAILAGGILAGAFVAGSMWAGRGGVTTGEVAPVVAQARAGRVSETIRVSDDNPTAGDGDGTMMGEGYGDGTMMGEGYGSGMMMGGGYYGYQPGEAALTLEQAWEAAEAYIAGDPDLEITEVMAFTDNFYAQAREKDTGRYSFELLINPYTGAVYPEMGPNMMWNIKYGHMGDTGMGSMMMGGGRGGMLALSSVEVMGGYYYTPATAADEMTVTPDEAIAAAQAYLDQALPGTTAAEPAAFYGYYTLHVLRDGEVTGMLSVHGATGQVWYHTWHGDFVEMAE